MKLKIIELEKGKIRLSLEGEGHTFMNALTEEIEGRVKEGSGYGYS